MKKHVLCSVTFSRKSCRLWDNGGNRGATNDVTTWRIHACWISNAICTHAAHGHAEIYNTYCFSTATMLTRTRLIVTFIRTCTLPAVFVYEFWRIRPDSFERCALYGVFKNRSCLWWFGESLAPVAYPHCTQPLCWLCKLCNPTRVLCLSGWSVQYKVLGNKLR